MTKTFQVKDAERNWYILDASGLILGRVSTVAANILRGKNKPTYSPNVDSGDNVVVINASRVKLSKDSKLSDKKYYRHSGYPGGLKTETFAEAMEKHPERVMELAVKGMLPKNKLAAEQLCRLRVYAGSEHKHTQQLIPVNLKNISSSGSGIQGEAK